MLFLDAGILQPPPDDDDDVDDDDGASSSSSSPSTSSRPNDDAGTDARRPMPPKRMPPRASIADIATGGEGVGGGVDDGRDGEDEADVDGVTTRASSSKSSFFLGVGRQSVISIAMSSMVYKALWGGGGGGSDRDIIIFYG